MLESSLMNFLSELKLELRESAVQLSRLKLYNSSKWSAEALCGMCEIPSVPVMKTFMKNDDSPLRNRSNIQFEQQESPQKHLSGMESSEYDLYLLASTLFECKEYDRCAYYLADSKHPELKFLKLYSKYLSWDKKTQENMESSLAPRSSKQNTGFRENAEIANREIMNRLHSHESGNSNALKKSQKSVDLDNGESTSIPMILKELNNYLLLEGEKPTFGISLLHYLRGVLYKIQDIPSNAISSFLSSLTLFPFNWVCWTELLSCISRTDESVLLLKILSEKFTDEKTQVMLKFFKLSIFQEFSGNIDDFIQELDYLLSIFPNFAFLKTQHALINYHYMDYVSAGLIFEQIIKLDPYRLEDMDTYSNILYVMQKPSKLAYLAQFASGVDRFRAETCCIIANYYSAKQEHEKSILYFRRALTLNKNCTSAWTLMGHEFVELKNSHAAIECYRRAVDINPRDFKAWYGLGQAYEVLDMHLYSLYYFQKSCALKPLDKRMWQALASCYEKVDNLEESIKCYTRALQLSLDSDIDTTILFRLAVLYEKQKDIISCKEYMLRCVEAQHSTDGFINDETTKASLWLARYEARYKNFSEAYKHALRVTHGSSQEIEEARAIVRECRKRMD
ncbi:anaphase promoting complex subunit CDC23 [Lachancea thermotolerans CBS 6340]|uniref:KLTH0H00704p n=1 Tax=Lachancea thermotolerans (strain ATCC 56472 / CBS 6340 / NRRL Y-8284) TaxID=559295 RepID=C5E1Y7_LACTC|nr:KLTH0H00704p [Lachancea thermotolerans CBS 6340]CAR30048.1 KLTH0H00704p [Lachancea thermotolerans CBS 6340]